MADTFSCSVYIDFVGNFHPGVYQKELPVIDKDQQERKQSMQKLWGRLGPPA